MRKISISKYDVFSMRSILLGIVIYFTSCVSKSDYDLVAQQNSLLKQEVDSLKIELDEFKLNPAHVLEEIKNAISRNDFTTARSKIDLLIEKHPISKEAGIAKNILANLNEDEDWAAVANSNNINSFESYLSRYPQGRYSSQAKSKIDQIRKEIQRNDYEDAMNSNTSSKWRTFLQKYPDHPEKNSISKKIIQAEVREIMGDSRTGIIPPSQRERYEYSSTSTISIRNDTRCNLIVRYSGPDVKSVTIAPSETVTVYLQSGLYDIAATACGVNYAGSENLQGSYSSSYYIVTSRY